MPFLLLEVDEQGATIREVARGEAVAVTLGAFMQCEIKDMNCLRLTLLPDAHRQASAAKYKTVHQDS